MLNVTPFMFHDVRDCSDSRYMRRYNLRSFLTVKQFVDQLKYIMGRYKIISSKQLYNIHEETIEGECAVLTFDDGLLDHYANVFPILKYYNVSGTFLVAAKPAIEDYIIHSHKIQFILSCVENEEVLVERLFDKLNLDSFERASLWEKYSVSNFKDNWWTKEMIFVTNFLRYHAESRYSVVNELFNEFVTKDNKAFNEFLYMKTEHIERIIKSDMIVGGHGYTSENLLSLNDEERYEDITKSLDFVKYFSTDGFISFSYPNGSYNHKVIDDIKTQG